VREGCRPAFLLALRGDRHVEGLLAATLLASRFYRNQLRKTGRVLQSGERDAPQADPKGLTCPLHRVQRWRDAPLIGRL
jgi:hypothetical protein